MNIGSVYIYVVAISLQLSGALLLVEFFLHKGARKNIIKLTLDNSSNLDFGETESCGTKYVLSAEDLRKQAVYAHKSIIAFVFISFGYLIGVFGDIGTHCKCCVCLSIIVLSASLLGLGNMVSYLLARIKYSKDISVIERDDGTIEVEKDTIINRSNVSDGDKCS